MRRTKDQEVRDILEMFEAIEKAYPKASFPGFDNEMMGLSPFPWEGGHNRRAEELRSEMEGRMKRWPNDSHEKHLKDYRRMIKLWTKWGRPKGLTEDQAKKLIEVGRIYIQSA